MIKGFHFFRQWSDYVGIFSAFVCLLHCLAAPVLLALGSQVQHHHLFDESWNYLFLGIGLVAVWFSSQHSDRKWMKVVLWSTFGLLAIGVFFESMAEWFDLVIYASSIALITAHLINLRKHLHEAKISKLDRKKPSISSQAA